MVRDAKAEATTEAVLAALQRAAAQKGALMERATEALLSDLGFRGVRRQRSGSQFGCDLRATRGVDDGEERWVFECKNLSKQVNLADIAPKLVWHHSGTVDAFVLVSASDVANDVVQLVERHPFPMDIHLWCGRAFADLVRGSPNALRVLGVAGRPTTAAVRFPAAYAGAAPAALDVVHHDDPPGALDYVMGADGGVAKCYVHDDRFVLDAHLSRRVRGPVIAKRMEVVITSHEPVRGRVLQLLKPKGLFEPHEFHFTLSPSRPQVDLLGGKWLAIDRAEDGCARLLLDDVEEPGLYAFHVAAAVAWAGDSGQCRSATFLLHEPGPDADFLRLIVRGRHYDSGAAAVLRLPEGDWRALQREATREDASLFLGPTGYEVARRIKDTRWIIRRQGLTPLGDGHFAPHEDLPGEPFMRLRAKVEEPLYTTSDALARLRGAHTEQRLLPAQLTRRSRGGRDLAEARARRA